MDIDFFFFCCILSTSLKTFSMNLHESPSSQKPLSQKLLLSPLLQNPRLAVAAAAFNVLAGCGNAVGSADQMNSQGGSAGSPDGGAGTGGGETGGTAGVAGTGGIAGMAGEGGTDAGPLEPCLFVSAHGPAPKMITKGEEYTSVCTAFSNQCDFPVQLELVEYDIVGVGLLSDLDSHWLVNENGERVSEFESISQESGSVIFNNLDIAIGSGEERELCLEVESNESAQCGSSIRHDLNPHEDLLFTLPNGENLSTDYITPGYIVTAELTTLGCNSSPTLACRESSIPNSQSVPSGAKGVEFACFDCVAGGGDVYLYELEAHRFGVGDEDDFDDVYLYHDDIRLTSGQAINPQTQSVTFTGIDEALSEGTFERLCVVADIASTAIIGSQHGFRIVSSDKISSSAATISGNFPVSGPTMIIVPGF